MVRDQEVGGSNPLAPTKYPAWIQFISLPVFSRFLDSAVLVTGFWLSGPNQMTSTVDYSLHWSAVSGFISSTSDSSKSVGFSRSPILRMSAKYRNKTYSWPLASDCWQCYPI